jgi:hypothetical protein
MAASSESPKPAKWWHTMLTTPALLVALGGGLGSAVPAIWGEWKSWRLGIQSNRIQIVQEQQTLWQKNLDCLRLKPVYTIVLDEGVEVGVTLCSSGDALLRYQRNPDTVSYTWIKYPTEGRPAEPQHSRAGDVVIPQSLVVYGATRCILQQSLVVLWVLHDNTDVSDACHMDYVSTIKGVLLKTQAVPCAACDG